MLTVFQISVLLEAYVFHTKTSNMIRFLFTNATISVLSNNCFFFCSFGWCVFVFGKYRDPFHFWFEWKQSANFYRNTFNEHFLWFLLFCFFSQWRRCFFTLLEHQLHMPDVFDYANKIHTLWPYVLVFFIKKRVNSKKCPKGQ